MIERLKALGQDVQGASRSSSPSFDWNDDSNWNEVLAGVKALYVTYHPDLSVPGASDHIRALLAVAKAQGVERVVIRSRGGEEESHRCERIVRMSRSPATIVSCGWVK
ncbi:MAG: NmrA family transcriptional regulator, partial [Verrucomicrobiota bacterium]